jgi:Trypsin
MRRALSALACWALLCHPAAAIVGHGKNDSGKQDDIARMATLTVISPHGDNMFTLATHAVVSDQRRLGACDGDSGAPAYDLRLGAPFLVGIVRGGGCGRSTIMTPIHPYREWLSGTAQRMRAVLGP